MITESEYFAVHVHIHTTCLTLKNFINLKNTHKN